jgi:hypothetical protein
MSLLVVISIFAALFAVFALILGISSMAHGGDADQNNSQALMRARVASHAIAFGLLLLAAGVGLLR